MTVTELINSVQFVTLPDGQDVAQLERKNWDDLVTLLEELEDVKEMIELRQLNEETISWEEAKSELRAEGVDL